jgi:hypothetical protein
MENFENFEIITNAKTGEDTYRPFTEEEIAARQPTTEKLSSEARTKRNKLLMESDWTQVLDAPLDQTAWATYRQELRDITDQTGFPNTIVWPEKPE